MFINMLIHFQIEDIAEAPAADPLSCAGAPDEPPPVHVPCTTSTKSTQVNKVFYINFYN